MVEWLQSSRHERFESSRKSYEVVSLAVEIAVKPGAAVTLGTAGAIARVLFQMGLELIWYGIS
jgi:hypothetical protein